MCIRVFPLLFTHQNTGIPNIVNDIIAPAIIGILKYFPGFSTAAINVLMHYIGYPIFDTIALQLHIFSVQVKWIHVVQLLYMLLVDTQSTAMSYCIEPLNIFAEVSAPAQRYIMCNESVEFHQFLLNTSWTHNRIQQPRLWQQKVKAYVIA